MSEAMEKAEPTKPAKQPTKPAAKPAPRPQSSGSSGAFLAMVIALAAGGGSYYVWQQHLIAEQDRQALQQSIAQLLEVVAEKERAQTARIEQLRVHHHETLEKRLAALEQRLPELNHQLSLQQHEWELAEVDYLLRQAEHNLQLRRDIPTTLAALREARTQLITFSNGHYAELAANIAETIRSLAAVEQPGSAPLITRLGALLSSVEALPFAVAPAERLAPPPTASVVESGAPLSDRLQHWAGVVWHDIKSLVTIRRNDKDHRPQSTAEQRELLQAQLRLKLETARLALLAHDQPLYTATLQEAAQWLQRFYDTHDGQVIETMATLNQLADSAIEPALPSLQGLRQQLHAEQPAPPANAPPPVVEGPVTGGQP